jgi:hypothetical protein
VSKAKDGDGGCPDPGRTSPHDYREVARGALPVFPPVGFPEPPPAPAVPVSGQRRSTSPVRVVQARPETLGHECSRSPTSAMARHTVGVDGIGPITGARCRRPWKSLMAFPTQELGHGEVDQQLAAVVHRGEPAAGHRRRQPRA